jgi:hypothetical protein
MGRQSINKEMHNSDVKTEQKSDVNLDTMDRGDSDIVRADEALLKDYADALAFMEDPVTIRLTPSTDKNAATAFPAWCNGKKAEVFLNGRWVETPDGYLPVGVELITKRKYLEIILRAKIDAVQTIVGDATVEKPMNHVKRSTYPVHSVSIIKDDNPRGAAWATEIIRRNY